MQSHHMRECRDKYVTHSILLTLAYYNHCKLTISKHLNCWYGSSGNLCAGKLAQHTGSADYITFPTGHQQKRSLCQLLTDLMEQSSAIFFFLFKTAKFEWNKSSKFYVVAPHKNPKIQCQDFFKARFLIFMTSPMTFKSVECIVLRAQIKQKNQWFLKACNCC